MLLNADYCCAVNRTGANDRMEFLDAKFEEHAQKNEERARKAEEAEHNSYSATQLTPRTAMRRT